MINEDFKIITYSSCAPIGSTGKSGQPVMASDTSTCSSFQDRPPHICLVSSIVGGLCFVKEDRPT